MDVAKNRECWTKPPSSSENVLSAGWGREEVGVGLRCDHTGENPLNFILRTLSCECCEGNLSALSHSEFFMALSLHFHVTLCWVEKLECVEQKASRASINSCCRGGTNVLHSLLKRMGFGKALAGFIFINRSNSMGSSVPCPHGVSCSSPGGMGTEQLGSEGALEVRLSWVLFHSLLYPTVVSATFAWGCQSIWGCSGSEEVPEPRMARGAAWLCAQLQGWQGTARPC